MESSPVSSEGGGNGANEDMTVDNGTQDKSLEEAPDCAPGTYRKQDLAARQSYMRDNGLKPLENGRILPKRAEIDETTIPTFYADESQKEQRLKARDHILASIAAYNKPEEASLTVQGNDTLKSKKKKKKRKQTTESNAMLDNEIIEEPPKKKIIIIKIASKQTWFTMS
jgi:hypothetical protein